MVVRSALVLTVAALAVACGRSTRLADDGSGRGGGAGEGSANGGASGSGGSGGSGASSARGGTSGASEGGAAGEPDCTSADAPESPLRRLSRFELANTFRDLFD